MVASFNLLWWVDPFAHDSAYHHIVEAANSFRSKVNHHYHRRDHHEALNNVRPHHRFDAALRRKNWIKSLGRSVTPVLTSNV